MSAHNEEATENAQVHLIADEGPRDQNYDAPAPDVEAGAGVVSAAAGVDSGTAVDEAPAPEPDASGALLLKSVYAGGSSMVSGS